VCACISISIDVGFADPHDRSHCTDLSLFFWIKFNLFIIAWIEGFAIFVAVFVVASVGSYNDYKKEE
jgi:hypothetical protein